MKTGLVDAVVTSGELEEAYQHLYRLEHRRADALAAIGAASREIATSPDLSPILIVRDQVEQVLLNLILNAIEAMPQGGELSIRAYEAGVLVHIDFADNGCGMSTAVLQQLFEPFFSTKHSGSGLGLAISHEIVDDEINIRKGLQAMLGKDGHTICDAGSGAEALNIVQTFACEAAIIDIRVPGMQGTVICASTARRIRCTWPEKRFP